MTATRQAFSVSVAPDGAFVLTGELDLSTAGSSETWSFMDGSVIHWLVETCDETDHPVVLRNASPVVRRILDPAATLGPDGDAWLLEAN
jgi:hypothetical protein